MASVLPPQRRNWVLEGEMQVRAVLTGCGLQDAITYPLIGDDDNARLLAATPSAGWTEPAPEAGYTIPALLRPADSVQLANPLSVERSTLRSSLLPNLLQVAAANLRYAERVAMFEIGRVYWPVAGELLPREPRHLSLVLTGPRAPESWLRGDEANALDFYDLKGIVETLLDRLGVPADQVRYLATAHPAFTARVARVAVAGQDVGVVGELHPLARKAFDLPAQGRVVVAELALEPLLPYARHDVQVTPISAYPAIKEDLAIVVDEAITAEQVMQTIRAAGGEMLVDVRLFDVYRGGQIAAGHKSLAYRLTYQVPDRSLTDADAARVRDKIVRRLADSLGAKLRT
jgi:phenylalanyl-tRNA synthetase beta chain